MGASQWRPDSTYSQNAGFLATGILQGVADQAIGAGELCTLFESGAIRRTDPTLPWAAINQSGNSPVVIYPATPVANISLTGMTVAKASGFPARVVSGVYIVPMQTSAGVGFTVRSSTGLQVTGFVLVSTDNSSVPPYAVALDNGNHALIWHVGANLKFAVYTPLGVQVVAAVTVETACYVAGQVPWHGHCKLANGNLALSWTTTSGQFRTQVFNPSTGVAVTTITAVDTSINGGMHAAVPCANGDFLVACFDGNHSLHKVYRITNAGVIVWGSKTPSTATAIFSAPDAPRMHPQHNRIVELINGNIAWVLPASSSSTYANIFVLNSSGVTQQQVDPGALYHDAGVACPISVSPNGFAISHANASSPNTYASFFDVNGNALQINVVVDTSAYSPSQGASPTVHTYMGFAGAGFGICRYVNDNGKVEIRQMHCDHRGTLLAPPIDHQPITPSDTPAIIPHCDKDGMVFVAYFAAGSAQITIASVKVGASSVIGVSPGGAAAGAAVTINAAGYYSLPSTQIFGVGNAFDQRNATIVGCRGTVGGQTAVLFGWE